ncbi:ribonuclease T2 [Hoeflea halophila]|uniref:Ribonuclease T2 n=1 Tax=Hoeflea halophila TaxID=714899 RepID=A0A286IB72_9HYPH|nr:ribonuclease [Hoeflea halophila]SOE17393.1 ribonuclease T2 [Hoeflea halophila]
MARPTFLRVLLGLTVLMLGAACSDDGTPPAQAETHQASGSNGLPLGSGFDFYVLALSWSPAYCLVEGDRANRQQCAEDRDLGFVVHGLWPQFENGYPEFCPSREPDRVPSQLGRNYLDTVPSMGLIGHQWRKHGSCSGLTQAEYLKVLRAAREQVVVPKAFALDRLPARVDALEAEDAFIAANPGMTREGIAVKCQRGLLREVRICMTPSLGFRSCGEIDRNGCTIEDLNVPEPG